MQKVNPENTSRDIARMAARASLVFVAEQRSGAPSSPDEAVISVRIARPRLGERVPLGRRPRREFEEGPCELSFNEFALHACALMDAPLGRSAPEAWCCSGWLRAIS